MDTVLHKANTRGHANHGWLDTYHTFSFADYYNPERIRFRNLRVLNDDFIAPGMGFGKHPHDNMEIVTILLEGSLLHEDSMGHQQIIKENEVQIMSAGSGIFHSEYNASKEKAVKLLQIWILPDKKNIEPTYNQLYFPKEKSKNQWQTLVSNINGPLKLNQKVTISRTNLTANSEIMYQLLNKTNGVYLFVIDGEVNINETILGERDGIGIENCTEINLKAIKDSYILGIEL